MIGPKINTNALCFGQVCHGCEYLAVLRASTSSKAEVVSAHCHHPENDTMFLGGMLLARGLAVDTPNDCPVLVTTKNMN